jgi:CubicO group peptidase (beta-lactamase class C family)
VSPHSGLNQPDDYGYGWHLTHYHASGVTYGAYEAQGNGGQFVVVVPRLRLVVGIMAANYGNFRTWGRFHDLIERYIVAACR